ncbi:hypothetical protein D3C76_1015710 [compost metagenome]
MQRLFGQVEVTEQANQRRQDAPRILAIDSLDLLANLDFAHHQFGILWAKTSTRRSRLSPQPR